MSHGGGRKTVAQIMNSDIGKARLQPNLLPRLLNAGLILAIRPIDDVRLGHRLARWRLLTLPAAGIFHIQVITAILALYSTRPTVSHRLAEGKWPDNPLPRAIDIANRVALAPPKPPSAQRQGVRGVVTDTKPQQRVKSL
jgi:hypothetical protein